MRLLRHAPLYALRFARQEIEQPEPFVVFDGQPGFDLGKQPIHVIHAPGHTAGSVCYRFDGLVFTGDTLLRQHVGRTDLPGGDAAQLKNSINLLLTGLPEDTILFPGHGRPWTIGEARVWWQKAAAAPPAYNQFE
jgi:glyoxylase-like metal-dependent hydrolase (beta-lactamase superfamily II)